VIRARAVRRARAAVRSWQRTPAAADPWTQFLTAVEPTLGAQARVHRFAQAPLFADPRTVPVPVAAWIEGDGPGRERTADALRHGTTGPEAILGGSLADAVSATRCEHLVLLRAGDIPAALAVERLGQALAVAADAAVVTCDEDVLGPDGERSAPHFRPGPSPDHWLACDDSGSMLVVARRGAAERLGDLHPGGGWRHELALALAGRGAGRHAHVPLLLCHRASGHDVPGLSAAVAGRAVGRWEPGAWVEQTGATRRVRRSLPGEPSVEIVVCFRDRAELTERCAASVLQRTAYQNLRLTLVDNGSEQPATFSLIGRLSRDRRVRAVRDERPFNFAALNNAAAETSDADVLLFLNNDTEVLDGDWLEPLLEEALRPEIGAVAPMLLHGDGTVQHAGAALGMHGYAGHPFAGLTPGALTPFGSAAGGTRNWLAVTAACMMVQRSKFVAIGGFDEGFVVAGNDVDLCLRLTAAGHRSLCVPHVRLLHDESRSRGAHIDPGDFAASERSYGAFRTVGDPFYNPNLTLSATDCRVRAPGETVG
jgi:O-antigen biosynthesis protein